MRHKLSAKRAVIAGIVLIVIAAFFPFHIFYGTSRSLPPDKAAAAIRRNLASWRSKPGKEVFINRAHRPCYSVDLAAAPEGRLYLSWLEASRENRSRVLVASSSNGDDWRVEGNSAWKPGDVIEDGPALAAGPQGRAIVVWIESESIALPPSKGPQGPASLPRQGVNGGRQPKAGLVARCFAALITEAVAQPPPLPDFKMTAKCFVSHRSPQGAWSVARQIREVAGRMGIVSVSADNRGNFWLVWRETSGSRSDKWHRWVRSWEPGVGWQKPMRTEVGSGVRKTRGRWDGPIVAVGGGVIVADGQAGWHSIGTVGKNRAVSVWVQPNGLSAAVVRVPVRLIGSQLALSLSSDLRNWSQPRLLGLIGSPAVACTGHDVYLATTYEPGREKLCRQYQFDGKQVTFASPRVFRVAGNTIPDTDKDGLDDFTEEVLLTDYRDADTDGDGVGDSEDLDPLAAYVPRTDRARICQALFDRAGCAEETETMVAAVPERQVFRGHGAVVLCLTHDEAMGYFSKDLTSWTSEFYVKDIKLGTLPTATARWGYQYGDLGGEGGTARLVKLFGKWIVVWRDIEWVS